MPIEKQTRKLEIEVEMEVYQCDRCRKTADGSMRELESTNGTEEYQAKDYDSSPDGWLIARDLAPEGAPEGKKPQLCPECVEEWKAMTRRWIETGR